MSDYFWLHKSLDEMTEVEWESLCDGCGRCCLQKLECEDSGEIFYTRLACRLFDLHSCCCQDYQHRFEKVPDCISLKNLAEHEWLYMPDTCAYRLVKEGKALFQWHPLISGNHQRMDEEGVRVKGRVLPEQSVAAEDVEEHIIHWISY